MLWLPTSGSLVKLLVSSVLDKGDRALSPGMALGQILWQRSLEVLVSIASLGSRLS